MLVLSRRDVLELLTLDDCIAAVERAFRLHAEGRTLGPGVLGVPARDGGFHIKAAGLMGERSYFAAKTNANFPDNPRRFGRPTIQGTVVLADASTGVPLAVMDSGSVTALRTGAATAVAARLLARSDAHTATIVGCGVQGEIQLAAIAAVLPLQRVWLLDTDHARAEALAARAAARFGLRADAAKDLPAALRESAVCVTCTPSRRAFLAARDVAPGTFVAAVGADNAVHAELADVVIGRRPGRTRDDEITVFDSSGTALEDVAAATAVYENARAAGRGTEVALDD